MKRAVLPALFLPFLVLTGCIVGRPLQHSTLWAPDPVVATMPPPAPVQTVGAFGQPVQGQAWVDGHWDLRGGNYQWVGGHWEQPPQQGWVWQQPAWHQGRWHQGYWHDPRAPIAQAYVQGHGAWNPGWNGARQGWNQGAVAVVAPAQPAFGANTAVVTATPAPTAAPVVGGGVVGGAAVAVPVAR